MATRVEVPPEAGATDGAVVFVESNTSGSGRLFAQAARRLGYFPMMLAVDPGRYRYVETDGLHAAIVDTANLDAVVDACRAIAAELPVCGVTSSSEYYIGTAAAAARELSLPGPDPGAIATCRDKERQRGVFAAAGVPSASFAGASTIDEAVAAAHDLGYPVVVKPIQGTASIGVRYCCTADEVRAIATVTLAAKANERGLAVPRRVLVEQWLQGSEVSAEIFDGDVIGVTQKHATELPYFVAAQHDFPADRPGDEIARIGEVAREAVHALGLTWGPVHVELTVTSDGPRLIEINPRLAGAYIPTLVELALGIDLVTATIEASAGRAPNLAPTRHRWASIRFVMRSGSGALRRFTGVDTAAAIDGVQHVETTLDPGQPLARLGDFRDRIGSVIAVADDAATAHARAAQAAAAIGIERYE